jgi:hypothetical protein
MATVLYCAKQATAMAEFASDRARARLDAAIDAEASRDELIAARTQELVVKRMAEMAPIDVVAGMQSITEGGSASLVAEALKANDFHRLGLYVKALIDLYIEQDSETMAYEWMRRIDRELSQWEH